ncbi:MAG: glycoside hydrolase family 95 protein [Cellulosilyticaceae bacterium]
MRHIIRFATPTNDWEEGMPIGNGRLGAMILGNVQEEKIPLNEESIWYGGPKNRVNPDARGAVASIRQLLFEGKIEKAQRLARMALTSTPQYINPYVPSGDAWLFFEGHQGPYQDYKRELDLDQAVARVQYQIHEKQYEREYIVSHPDGVIAMRLSCSEKGGLSLSVNLNRRPYEGESGACSTQMITLDGECGKEGVTFTTVMGATSPDGVIQTIGNFISIQEATEVTLYIATETSFRDAAYRKEAIAKVEAAMVKGYERLKESHVKDYEALSKRNTLDLYTDEPTCQTDELIQRCREGEDSNALMALIYQFGKYLLIASSRPGSLPANLQGIWNQSHTPAWESNYTININTQMNYWPAEVTQLGDCHEPLFDFIERLCENGKQVAKEMYGCKGSVAHHVSNLWADAAPGGIFAASPFWPMGLAWLSLHMYEHYCYTGDRAFLAERCYPVIQEVAIFLMDYLTLAPEGYLVTGPSVSPENSYYAPGGEVGALCMGPTMDTQIVRAIFDATQEIEACLEIMDGLTPELRRIKTQLPPTRVGKYGQVMEWYQDYDEAEPGHRHMSPLFGLHPTNQITQSKTPELFEAAKVTLRRRLAHGGGHTGWSKAWMVNFYARLLEGEDAYMHLRDFLSTSIRKSLLDVHPPFQIDGNFGICAAIGEMIVQSHEGFIRLLPALPKAWPAGHMEGICARGGFVIELAWEAGEIKALQIHAKCEGTLKIHGIRPVKVTDQRDRECAVNYTGECMCLTADAGSTYCFLFAR